MMTMEIFFIGVASGSQVSAVKRYGYPYIMLNYATKIATKIKPWNSIKILFIDSGGYSFFHSKGEYTTSDEAYIRYILRRKPDYFALRDYPCEPDILTKWRRTVQENQEKTLDKHLNLLNLMDDWNIWKYSEPVAVLQGWTLDDYLKHYDMMKEYGVFSRISYVGIGTLCRRGQENTIRKIVTGIREALPKKFKLHGFGVKISALKYKDVFEALYSADSVAWGLSERLNYKNSDGYKVEGQLEALKKFVKKIDSIFRTHMNQRVLDRWCYVD